MPANESQSIHPTQHLIGSALREWIDNQNTVFANCDAARTQPILPVLPSAAQDEAAAAFAVHDFPYQTASALFYAGQMMAAIERFSRIAEDLSSPYRPAARYNLARILVIEGRYPEAGAAIQAILTDPSLGEVHDIAMELMGAAGWDSADPDLLEEQLEIASKVLQGLLTSILSTREALTAFRTAQDDLRFFLRSEGNRNFTDAYWLAATPIEYDPRAEAVRRLAARSEMIDWLQTMAVSRLFSGEDTKRQRRADLPGLEWPNQGWLSTAGIRVRTFEFRQATANAVVHWRRGDGLHWAMAAMTRVTPSDEASSELLRLFEEIEGRRRDCTMSQAEAVAYGSMFVHAVRLRLTGGDPDGALRLLRLHDQPVWYEIEALAESLRYLVGTGQTDRARQFLASRGNERIQDTRELRGPRMALASSLEEFLRVASRESPFDISFPVLNLMPARILASIFRFAVFRSSNAGIHCARRVDSRLLSA